MAPRARTVEQEGQSLAERLEAAGRAVRSAQGQLANELELRRRVVHEAADQGMPMREIGRRIGGGTGMVSKILSNAGREDEEG